MRRVLFNFYGFAVYSYPFLLYVGTVLGILVGMKAAASRGITSPRMCLALVSLVIPALVGSRWLFLLSHLRQRRFQYTGMLRRSEGGASLYGGLILSLLLSFPLLWLAGMPFGQFWDAATITILVGMVFTKVGCMLNGCCAGRETQGCLALYLPNMAGIWRRRVPSQLLEAALASALLLTAPMVWRRLPFPGSFFLLALFAYAVGRFWLENTRENIDRIWGFSLHRVISGLLATLSITELVLLSYARHLKR